MLKHAALLLTLCILGSCALFPPDIMDGCGKRTHHTITVELKLSGHNSEPIPDAALICLDTGEELGKTNSMGLISMRVPGSYCTFGSFRADCEVAVFRAKYSYYSHRPFWFARFLRGESLGATEDKVELIEDGLRHGTTLAAPTGSL